MSERLLPSLVCAMACLVPMSHLAAADVGVPVVPGVLPVPPVATPALVLPESATGRQAVRGCPVTMNCDSTKALLASVDAVLFGHQDTAQGPWLDEVAPTLIQPPLVKVYKRPSEIRPDLPWLDELELPDLPVRWTPRLVDYLLFYKNDRRGRAIMAGWLRAQGRYRGMIESHLREAGLPADLLYVAMIESSYDPMDGSRAGAAGLWQFMPAGGKIYGLTQDRWVDERRDPLRSTVAVMRYWADLYQRFGDWHLAMAAFNAGYGAVIKSIARFNTNDYWQLCEFENGLPWETTLYVPKALAVAIVGHNRARFGFDTLVPDPPEAAATVAVPASISLGIIAKALGVPQAEVVRRNPHLRRQRTPPQATPYVLRVPVGTHQDFARRLADLQSEWDGYDAYVVNQGERFEDIATQFGLSSKKLRQLNEVDHVSEVIGGTVLVVPRVSAAVREANRQKAQAALYASGPDQQPGEPLIVAVPDKDVAISGRRRIFYRVVAGDSQNLLARRLGVSRRDLAAWNGLDAEALLHPRMILQAFVAPGWSASNAKLQILDDSKLLVVTRGSKEHLDITEQRVGRVRVEYAATRQESYESIAKKYGLTAYDLARINRKPHTTVVEKGETVVVYQVVDRTRSERAQTQWAQTPRPQRKASATAEPTDAVTGKTGEAAVRAANIGELVDGEADGEADVNGERDGAARNPAPSQASEPVPAAVTREVPAPVAPPEAPTAASVPVANEAPPAPAPITSPSQLGPG